MFVIVSCVDLTLQVENANEDRNVLIKKVRDAGTSPPPYDHFEEHDDGKTYRASLYLGDVWVLPMPVDLTELLGEKGYHFTDDEGGKAA